jgi:hypothetical protein
LAIRLTYLPCLAVYDSRILQALLAGDPTNDRRRCLFSCGRLFPHLFAQPKSTLEEACYINIPANHHSHHEECELERLRSAGPHRIEEIRSVYRGAKKFTGSDAQYLFQVLTDPARGCGSQCKDRHIRKLLLQNTQLLVVRPASKKISSFEIVHLPVRRLKKRDN